MSIKPIKLKLFTPGKKIYHNGQYYTVHHVRVCGSMLLVKFEELSEEIDSDYISCELTELHYK